MKEYPSIDGKPLYGAQIYAFDKLDGSNVRAEWAPKKGFWKFGRRHGLLDDSNPFLLEAPKLIEDTYGDSLGKIFTDQRWQKVTAFFEFYGPGSFAGTHEVEPHKVTLFDIVVDKKGILPPREFVRIFQDKVETPELLYTGVFGHMLESEVQAGTFPGVTFEGVVCKGALVSPGRPLMFKVKTDAWLHRLRFYCGDNHSLFGRLV